MEAAVGAAAAAAVETPTHVSKVLPKRQPPAGPWHPLDVRNSIQRAQQEAERKRSDAALMVRGSGGVLGRANRGDDVENEGLRPGKLRVHGLEDLESRIHYAQMGRAMEVRCSAPVLTLLGSPI